MKCMQKMMNSQAAIQPSLPIKGTISPTLAEKLLAIEMLIQHSIYQSTIKDMRI